MSSRMVLRCTNSFALFRHKFNGHFFPSIYHIDVSSLTRHVSSTTALSFCQLQASKLHDSPVTVASDVRYGGKQIISVDSALYDYILSNVREPTILRELREETATMRGSHMQVSPDQAQLLAMLVRILGAKRCIEVGTYTGYSSLAVALVLPEGGHLVACERDGKSIEVAKRYYDRAGVSHKVDVRHGLAADTLKSLIQNGEICRNFLRLCYLKTLVSHYPLKEMNRQRLKETIYRLFSDIDKKRKIIHYITPILCRYDFAFVDAEKRMYQEYFELLLQLVRVGGLIVVDNVLWHGRVSDPLVNDSKTLSIRNFNENLMEDNRVDISMVPIGDGMTICRKR